MLRIPEFVVTLPPAITKADLGRKQWLPFCYSKSFLYLFPATYSRSVRY